MLTNGDGILDCVSEVVVEKKRKEREVSPIPTTSESPPPLVQVQDGRIIEEPSNSMGVQLEDPDVPPRKKISSSVPKHVSFRQIRSNIDEESQQVDETVGDREEADDENAGYDDIDTDTNAPRPNVRSEYYDEDGNLEEDEDDTYEDDEAPQPSYDDNAEGEEFEF